MDASLKLLSPHYPPSRSWPCGGWCSLPLICAWLLARRGHARILQVRWGLHLLRAGIGIGMLGSCTLRAPPPAAGRGLRHLLRRAADDHGAVGASCWASASDAALAGDRSRIRRRADRAAPDGAGVASVAGVAVLLAATGYAITAITVRC
jgi:hypothetical protein